MADKGGVVAGRPDFYTARNEFVPDLQTLFRKVGGMNAGAHFDAKIDQLSHRADLQILRESSEHSRFAFHQNHARLGGIDVAKIFCQRVTRNFGNGARHFDAGWAATNDDKCHRRFARRLIADFFGIFKRH